MTKRIHEQITKDTQGKEEEGGDGVESPMKRANTMQKTSEEGLEFLGNSSFKDQGLRTRTQVTISNVADQMLDDTKQQQTKTLTKDEEAKIISHFEMVFRLFSKDRKGRIEKEGLRSALMSVGKTPSDKSLNKIMKEADKNNDGSISKEEFVHYMLKKTHTTLQHISYDKSELQEDQKDQKVQKKVQKKEQKKSPKIEKKQLPKKELKKKEPKTKIPILQTIKPIFPIQMNQVSVGNIIFLKAEHKKDDKLLLQQDDKKEEEEDNGGSGMKRGLSITHFYTEFAGLHDEIVPIEGVDVHNNWMGRKYDLGQEGAFSQFKILVGSFYCHGQDNFRQSLYPALLSKGFDIAIANDVPSFVHELKKDWYDQVWIISGSYETVQNLTLLTDAVCEYNLKGGGIALWSDNEPYFKHANSILEKLCKFSLIGNTPGNNILKIGDGTEKRTFRRHLLTSGIQNLHEGVTICYPKDLTISSLATSSDGNVCMAFADHETTGFAEDGSTMRLDEKQGRIVVETGFTKMYKTYWDQTAGTERYVRNIAVWLLGLDHRLKNGFPIQGSLQI